MPYLLNIDFGDRDFRERSTQYFHDITLKVEPDTIKGEGQTKLEIGIPDPEAALSPTNLPYSVKKWAGIKDTSHHMGTLVCMNDTEKKSFTEIATYIRQNYENF